MNPLTAIRDTVANHRIDHAIDAARTHLSVTSGGIHVNGAIFEAAETIKGDLLRGAWRIKDVLEAIPTRWADPATLAARESLRAAELLLDSKVDTIRLPYEADLASSTVADALKLLDTADTALDARSKH